MASKHLIAQWIWHMKSFDLDARFEHLCELLDMPHLNEQRRQTLWTWIKKAHQKNPDAFRTTWVPYLASHPHHFIDGLATCDTIKTLSEHVKVLPLPCFQYRPPDDYYEEHVVSAAQIIKVIDSPLCAYVSNFDVSGSPFDDQCAKDLSDSPHATNIQHLGLKGVPITAAGLLALTNATTMSALERLHLDHSKRISLDFLADNGSTEHLKGLEALGQTRAWPKLHTLTLGACEIHDQGLRHLVSPTSSTALLSQLRVLDISYNGITTSGCASLLAVPMPDLTTLIAHNNQLDGDIASALAKASTLTSLTTLNIGNNEMGDAPALVIASAMQFQQLEHLALFTSALSDHGLCALATGHLSRLRTLDIPFNAIGDRGVIALAASPSIKTLEVLQLRGNQITSAGVNALAQSPNMRSLTKLELGFNTIDTRGAIALANSPYLGNLQELVLEGNEIGAEGAHALAHSSILKRAIRTHYAQWGDT